MGVKSVSATAFLGVVLIMSIPGNSEALEEAEASVSLGASHSWDFVLGMTDWSYDHTLEGILVYSTDGTALVYPAESGYVESIGGSGILVGAPTSYDLTPGAQYVAYTHFYAAGPPYGQSQLYVLAGSDVEGGSTLHVYGNDLEPTAEHEIPFAPKYVSNLWNGYNLVVDYGRIALAFADDHEVWMLNECPPPTYDPSGDPRTYTSNCTISNATILGNPLVVDGEFVNGSMLFVPTDLGLMAFDINVSKSTYTGDVLDVSIGEFRWMGEYLADGTSFVPVSGNHTISFWYPHSASTELGKELVALAADDSRVVAFDRETGEIIWSTHIDLETVPDLEIEGVHPSPDCLLVTGTDGQDGCLIMLDRETGSVLLNGTGFAVTEGRVLDSPEYIIGRMCYVTCTDADRILVYDRLLASRFVYDFSDVGLSCVPRYLGNIYIEVQRSGNYIGVVTGTPELLVCPFIAYADDVEDGTNGEEDEPNGDADGQSWPLLAIAIIVAATIIPVTVYLILRRRNRGIA